MHVLNKSFYSRDPAIVAQELLGKILVRKLDNKILSGKIVETEAYYADKDPASRAYKTHTNFAQLMRDEPGRTFIYMVHNNWLLNFVTMPKGTAAAVLIRAIEPLEGIEIMKRNRKFDGYQLTNGPGKLTKALGITKELSGIGIVNENSELIVVDSQAKFDIGKSNRIGVTKDLKRKLRFYIKENPFVSKF